MEEDLRIELDLVPIRHQLLEEQTVLAKGKNFVYAITSRVQLMVHGPGGSLGAPALYNVEEERKPGTEIALTHDLPMVVETALEDLVKSVHVIHSHAQLMVTGRRGGPGDDAHVLVVVELNRGLDLAPILHQPLVAQDVLDHEARHKVVMKSHSAQFPEDGPNGVAGTLVR